MRLQEQCYKGGALLLVLLVVSMLSAIVLTTVAVLQRNMVQQFAKASEIEAEAVHPNVERDDPILNYISDDGSGSYSVEISSEGGRIDLNEFLQQEEKSFLRQLIESWGVGFDDSAEIVDALVDWVDEDDIVQLNGAEDAFYQGLGYTGLPYNRPFSTLADVRLVKKFGLVEEVNPDWQNFFTVEGDSQIDIHEAPLDVLVFAGEVEEFLAEGFRSEILGEDNELGTEDDIRFATMEEALNALGVSDDEEVRDRVAARFRLNSTVRRVTSIGRSGGTTKEITIIVRQRGARPAILRYEETLSRNARE